MEWQPIETAPKDGTVVRLYIPGHPELEGMTGNFWGGEWHSYPQRLTLGGGPEVPDPIYWMPMPNKAVARR